MSWDCIGGTCGGPTRCAKHACIHARKVMDDRGWVLMEEYGSSVSKEVDARFCRVLEAVVGAGVELTRWIAGWDTQRGEPMFGIWAPRPVAAIINAMSGRDASAKSMLAAFHQTKVNPQFAAAVDAAWRIGGHEAAVQVIAAELPQLAQELQGSYQPRP